eukprot:gene1371-798_t
MKSQLEEEGARRRFHDTPRSWGPTCLWRARAWLFPGGLCLRSVWRLDLFRAAVVFNWRRMNGRKGYVYFCNFAGFCPAREKFSAAVSVRSLQSNRSWRAGLGSSRCAPTLWLDCTGAG